MQQYSIVIQLNIVNMKSLFLLTRMKMTKKKRSFQPLSPSVLAMKKKKKRTFIKSSQQYLSSTNSVITPEREIYLPDDCWEHVFSFIINPVNVFIYTTNPIVKENEEKNKLNFKSLSLVSKQFFSVTNRIIFSLRMYYPHLCHLSRFFHRFSNLNSLDLSFCIPGLVADIAFALRDRQTLKSLSIYMIELTDAMYITSYYIDSFTSLMGLNFLKFDDSQICDDLLYSIARVCLPLKTFVLENCTGYSYPGIYDLLSKCHGIQHLGLQGVDFLNNRHVLELSLFLPDMISINLSECSKLTESSLFALIKNCHSLSEITMENIYIERESESESVENAVAFKDFDVNPQLKFLHFAGNSYINDKIIILFASIFPNLQLLDLTYCYNISGKSICQVLSKCCKIRHLNLTNCKQVRQIKMNFVALQLEVLNLSGTKIHDKTLYEISKSCCGLLQLLLIHCKYLTEKGVMRVVKKCRQLKKIYLKHCAKVNVDAIISIISSNSSLQIDNCSSFAEVWQNFNS